MIEACIFSNIWPATIIWVVLRDSSRYRLRVVKSIIYNIKEMVTSALETLI